MKTPTKSQKKIKHGQTIAHNKVGNICCQGCYMLGLKDGEKEGKIEAIIKTGTIFSNWIMRYFQSTLDGRAVYVGGIPYSKALGELQSKLGELEELNKKEAEEK